MGDRGREGHARAQLALVLRALNALDIRLDASSEPTKSRTSEKPTVDIKSSGFNMSDLHRRWCEG